MKFTFKPDWMPIVGAIYERDGLQRQVVKLDMKHSCTKFPDVVWKRPGKNRPFRCGWESWHRWANEAVTK